MEEGLLPLSELLAEERLRWKSMANTEADCAVESETIPKSLYLKHEIHEVSRLKFNKKVSRHQESNGRFMDFGDEGCFMYKPKSGLVKDETLKCRQMGASGGNGGFSTEECVSDFVNDRFKEENFDCSWKSGSLSNEPLIHHKRNLSFKGATWICSQDEASVVIARSFCERFRSKSQGKIPKDTRRRHLPTNDTFQNLDETILHENRWFVDEVGGDFGVSSKHGDRPRNFYSLNNTCKGFCNNGTNLIHEESLSKCNSEKSLPECRDDLEGDASVCLLDEASFRVVISIVSAYIGQFLRDETFRKTLVRNCYFCLGFNKQEEFDVHNDGLVGTLKRAMDSIERVVDGSRAYDELKKAKLQLSVVADLNSDDFEDGCTCGISNSCLAACAHLYLGVLSKIQKKGKVAAKHILQVFCSSPSHARSFLLAELWGYLFLPHLLHLRVWYSQESENTEHDMDRSRKMKLLDKAYGKLLNDGTYKLAVYYKEWLSDRLEAPTVPSIGIPWLASGVSNEDLQFVEENLTAKDISLQPISGKSLISEETTARATAEVLVKDDYTNEGRHWEDKWKFGSCSRNLGSLNERKDEDGAHYLTAAGRMKHITLNDASDIPLEDAIHEHKLLLMSKDPCGLPTEDSAIPEELVFNQHVSCRNDFALKKRPVETISQMHPKGIFNSYSTVVRPPTSMDVIPSRLVAQCDGIYESNAGGTEMACVCTNDFFPCPSARLTETKCSSNSSNVFACPFSSKLQEGPVTLEAEHTIESWNAKSWKHFIPARVQRISSAIHEHDCYMDKSAISLLEQLISNPNVEENEQHARHFISLGALPYLMQRLETGKIDEKRRIVLLFVSYIQVDAGCKNYLVAKINKSTVIELLLQSQSRAEMVVLLAEMLCLDRRLAITNFLHGLQQEGAINLMHCLVIDLQRVPSECRPLISMLLLHLVVMQENKGCNIYREEALDSFVEALEHSLLDEKVRVPTCRALLILEGLFSHTGQALTEVWLLKLAGFKYPLAESSLNNENEGPRKDVSQQEKEEEEEARQEWLRSIGSIFFVNGKKPLWEAFSKCLACGAPELQRACLVFVTWLSCALGLLPRTPMNLWVLPILAPTLKQCLMNNDKVVCQALASLSLLNFMEDSREISDTLKSISEVIFAAEQLNAMLSRETRFS